MTDKKYAVETVPCPICGSDHYETVISQAKELYNDLDEYFDIVKCSQCGMFWTNPRPTAATIGYFYPDSAGYFKPVISAQLPAGGVRGIFAALKTAFLVKELGYPLETNKTIPQYASVGRLLLAPLLRRRARLMHFPKWVAGGKLLDVGCSWGGYPAKMREYGWQVEGIEPHGASADYAREELGIDVRKGQIDEMSFDENERYDVIHGSMVLEHVHEPKKVLQKIHTALKPDGQLILSIPDFGGWEARIFSRHAYTLHVPAHLNHFTPATIEALLKSCGFEVDEILHHHFDRDWIASMMYSECCPLLHRIVSYPLIRKTIVRPLVYLQGVLGKTSRMSIYASPR